MAEVKGKFIKLGIMLMGCYPSAQNKARDFLKSSIGIDETVLDPEGWYDTKLFDEIMTIYASSSLTKEKAIITLGRLVYPEIKKTAGLPPNLKTPLDFIMFEAEGFLANHRGNDVIPRKFVVAVPGRVIVEAPAPGYNPVLYEGVFLGILEMCGVYTGKVERNGDVFTITW